MEKQEKKLNAFLEDGEVVEWRSGPEHMELLDADNGNRIILRWSVTVLVTLALLSVYVGYYEVNLKLVALVLGIAAYNLVAPLLEKRNISRFQSYYITNRRVILGAKDSSFYYMNFEDIDEMKVVTGLGGRKSLVLGSCIFEKCEKQLRWLANHPKDDPDPNPPKDHVVGLTFYEPRNADAACALLHSRTRVLHSQRGKQAGGTNAA